MDVAGLIRTARDRACLTQQQLAQAAATSQSRVASYESGAAIPSVATIDRLLAACGVQARFELEMRHADVDAEIAALLAKKAALRLASGSFEGVLYVDQMAAKGGPVCLTGRAAARLHGAPVDADEVECVCPPGRLSDLADAVRLTRRDAERLDEGTLQIRGVRVSLAEWPPTTDHLLWSGRPLPVVTLAALMDEACWTPNERRVLQRLFDTVGG